jgi:putative transposase
MTDTMTTKKPRKKKAPPPFPVELIDQLLAQVQNKDAESILGETVQWQQRPLEPMYPIVYFDALRLKIRDEGAVKNKAVYLALGIRADGRKEVLGLWIEQMEGAKFWLKVFNELKNRGLNDVLIAVVDGLRGFPEAIEAVYPQAQIQTCIVHLIRNSLVLASWKDRKELAASLKPVYQAVNADVAAAALDDFAAGPWGTKFPTVAAMWKRQWEQVIPFFAYPPEVRTVIYTTNANESLHMQLRKIVKNRGHFPSDDAATKLLFLALRNIEKDWKMPARTWKQAVNQFAIMYGERFTNAIS